MSEIIHADCLDALRSMEDNSVDSICCDPPAGIHFMCKEFDHDKGGRTQWVAWLSAIMVEALRVTKPGGHALIWALPRTSHWTMLALEDAGWQIRDKVYFIFGSGFPKSLDISKSIDRIVGKEREVIGEKRTPDGLLHSARQGERSGKSGGIKGSSVAPSLLSSYITAPATPEAAQFSGYGTSLKPACEEWILCRKPISEPTIAQNVLRWGTGGLNIDRSRISTQDNLYGGAYSMSPRDDGMSTNNVYNKYIRIPGKYKQPTGRFPSHLLISHTIFCTAEQCDVSCPCRILDEQSGISKSIRSDRGELLDMRVGRENIGGYDDQGGASRYFKTLHEAPDAFYYSSKASRRDRSSDGTVNNTHPTCKSTQLMKYLISLITPENGICLDMFAGSGTTGVACIQEGFQYILIEKELEYINIIRARIAHAQQEMDNEREQNTAN